MLKGIARFALLALALPAAADAGPLDVVTLNTWGVPYPLASIARKERFPHINAWLRRSAVDVAGLEEVWRGARDLLRLDDLFFPRGGDSGLALVCRHAVADVESHPFHEARGFDAWKRKGVLQARIALDTGPLWVFVTHLQSGPGEANADVRAAQAAELLDVVGAVAGPAIVLGDFNLYARDPVDRSTWQRLHDAGLVDAADAVGNDVPTYLADHQRYDRVYVRGGDGVSIRPVAAEVVPYDADLPPLSDHQPVRVRLDVERG